METDRNTPVRCGWCEGSDIYREYHDTEWGRPVRDDRKLFEMLVLEGAQAGLSWLTVLRKRDAYRKAFQDFDFALVAAYTESDEARVIRDYDIVRNRLKVHGTVVNARLFGEIVGEYGSFYNYIMQFMPDGKRLINNIADWHQLPVTSAVSDAISLDMKKRGFKFFGSTICYSFLQATGFIDDHVNGCFCKGST